MKNKLVSIIVPVYNVEIYLERCIESIIRQTYKEIEIILVDDGSKDRSGEICDIYASNDERIMVIHKKNKGAASARNMGIDYAKGEYICFVDSDDWLDNNMIEMLVETIEDKKVDMVRCIYNEEEKIQLKKEFYQKEEICQEVIDYIIDGRLSAYLWLIIIKSELIKSNMKFDEDIYVLEDTLFYIELLLKIESIYFKDIQLYHYCMNEEGLTLSFKNSEKKIYGLIEYKRKVSILLKNNDLYNDERNTKINTIIANFIIYYIYKLQDKEILNNEEIENILKDVNSKELSLFTRMQIKNINCKRWQILEVLNKFKKIIKKEKT